MRHLSDLITKGQLCLGCTHPSMHLYWFSYTLVQEARALGVRVIDSRQLLAGDHCGWSPGASRIGTDLWETSSCLLASLSHWTSARPCQLLMPAAWRAAPLMLQLVVSFCLLQG